MLPRPAIRGIYRSDSRARAAYAEAAGIYRILPEAVCLPADVEDLRQLIRWARDHRVALIPRGAGSAMSGSNVGEGIIVDLTRMEERRLEVDAGNHRAVTSAAMTLAELNAAAGRHSLRLPPDPSSGAWATLGGMVATNAAGARSIRYGSVRRWVEALTLVTVDGETITLRRGAATPASSPGAALARFAHQAATAIQGAAPLIASRFPRTRKNSSGYALDWYLASGDLLDLVIGAEGTLGIVTEIEWQLDDSPPFRAGLRVALNSLDQLGDAVAGLSACQPSALELLDRTFLDLVGTARLAGAGLRLPSPEAVLLVEIERDDPESLRHSLEHTTALARPLADSVDTAFSPTAAERLWAIRHAASPILAGLPDDQRSLQVIEDACVPVDRMSDYIRAVRKAGTDHGVPVVMFGHAGDGHIHVNLLPEIGRAGWESAIGSVLDEVTEVVIRLGGTPSGEHGDGRLRSNTLARIYGPEIMDLFRLVKHSFDPLGLFNPGIILPTGEPPISRLKVGRTAVPLPADLQISLREIEQTGGYGRCRLEIAGEEGLGSRV
jgi:FAD/FMN-containing dehydrogenase